MLGAAGRRLERSEVCNSIFERPSRASKRGRSAILQLQTLCVDAAAKAQPLLLKPPQDLSSRKLRSI